MAMSEKQEELLQKWADAQEQAQKAKEQWTAFWKRLGARVTYLVLGAVTGLILAGILGFLK